jgi:hypothetical protein
LRDFCEGVDEVAVFMPEKRSYSWFVDPGAGINGKVGISIT